MKTYLSAILTAILIINASFTYGQDTPPQNPMLGSGGQQKPEATPLKDRFFFGGSLGLQFGSYTYVDVSPLVGFKVTEKFHVGIGLTYMYIAADAVVPNNTVKHYSTSDYGGRVFARYYFRENFFAHTEFEYLNLGYPVAYYPSYDIEILRENVTSWFVGGGYAQAIGPNAAITFMALWNLIEEANSPYTNPIFRIGITAGF